MRDANEPPPAPTSGKIDDIQRLRGLAVAFSVFAHMPLMTLPFILLGVHTPWSIGVPLFFVISGYVIPYSISKYPFNAKAFYLRRAFRILPVLSLSLAITLAMAMATHDAQFYGTFPSVFKVAGSMLLCFNNYLPLVQSTPFFAGVQNTHSVLGLWSISTEEQFYLLFPLAMLIPWARLRTSLLVVLFLTWGVALRAYALTSLSDGSPWKALLQPLATSDMFRYDLILLGMLLFYLPIKLPKSRALFIAAMAFFVAYPFMDSWRYYHTIGYAGFAGACAVIVGIAKNNADVFAGRTRWIGPLLLWLGERSYMIYVMHFQVLALTGYFLQRNGVNFSHPNLYNISITVLFIPSLVVLEMAHRYVEKPFIRLGYAITGHNRCEALSAARPSPQYAFAGQPFVIRTIDAEPNGLTLGGAGPAKREASRRRAA